jgi:hypothetical protein
MKFTNIVAPTTAAAAILAGIGVATAPTAAAFPTTGSFGARESLSDAGGAVVTGWTISNLRPSSDNIPFPVTGRLYEATATAEADQGTVAPIVSDFNARTANGQSYHVLDNVATPQGVNPSAIGQGNKTTGKLYFDVTGAAPDSVVYNNGVQDLLIWT